MTLFLPPRKKSEIGTSFKIEDFLAFFTSSHTRMDIENVLILIILICILIKKIDLGL